jgi:hypothetical protein
MMVLKDGDELLRIVRAAWLESRNELRKELSRSLKIRPALVNIQSGHHSWEASQAKRDCEYRITKAKREGAL